MNSYSRWRNQDIIFITFDAEKLTLEIPGEERARCLECRLLQPGEEEDARVMTAAEIADVFKGAGTCSNPDADAADADAEGSQAEDADMEVPDEDPVAMEAMNMLPAEIQELPGDGEMVEPDEVGAAEAHAEEECGIAAERLLKEALDADDEEWHVDEELVYQPCPKGQLPLEPGSSTASSSTSRPSAVGLHVTPLAARAMLPAAAGVKIQHKIPNLGLASPGWQAWISPSLPSRWFAYGGGASYSSKEAALEAAIAWVWEHHVQ